MGSLLLLTDGVSEKFADEVYEAARMKGISFHAALMQLDAAGYPGLPAPSAAKAGELVAMVTEWLGSLEVPDDAPEGGWGAWIVEQANDSAIPVPSDGLIELLGELDSLVESSPSLERFLGQVTPLGRDLATAKGDGIRIMAMAASKGLTVAATIVAGVESDIIPKPKAPSDEERRLLYVAMTRATDHLFVTWSRIRRGPTARSGKGRANSRRHHSRFLDGGTVMSQDGNGYLGKR